MKQTNTHFLTNYHSNNFDLSCKFINNFHVDFSHYTLRAFTQGDILLFHIIGKVVANNTLINDDFDQSALLSALIKNCNKFNGILLALVVTTTHYHAIIATDSRENSSNIFRFADCDYAQYYNSRYKREGTLFTSPKKGQANKLIRSRKHLFNLLEKYFPKNNRETGNRLLAINITNDEQIFTNIVSLISPLVANIIKTKSAREGDLIKIAGFLNMQRHIAIYFNRIKTLAKEKLRQL